MPDEAWKPITFAPYRGAILLCDFDMARIDPEMEKRRQVIVFSISSLNHKHALRPGLCVVIPTSSKEPQTTGPEDILIPAGKYWSLEKDSWVRAKYLVTVSHSRLSMLHRFGRPSLQTEFIDAADMGRISTGIKHALGIA